MRHIAIIGAGAAGVFTAVNTAEKLRSRRQPDKITLLEAADKPLQKVLISGGGRCNVTHACFEPRLLIQHYPRGHKELPSLFARFQPADMVQWLSERGLKLHTEPDGRMFPVENSSEAVIGLFLNLLRRYDVELRTRQRIIRIDRQTDHPDGGFDIHTQQELLHVDRLMLATGYSPPGWKLAEALGHTIIPPVPSLFPFKTQSAVFDDLQGISVPEVSGRLTVPPGEKKPEKFEATGPLLITHTGLSGPLIYRLSALGARALATNGYQAELRLDFYPNQNDETIKQALTDLFKTEAKDKKLRNTQFDAFGNKFASRLWLSLLSTSGAHLDEPAQVTSQKVLNQLTENLKRLNVRVVGKSPSKEEFVSCGGVDLKEVDFKTMQSKICPGLYLAGEILNIDGLTGGFNFQACWSEAWIASEALSQDASGCRFPLSRE